jgi:hypothetical protein
MADLNDVRRDDDTVPDLPVADGVNPARRTVVSDPAVLDRERAAAGAISHLDDPELARLQIEQTRARMSDTIDQIEGALLRKKAAVEEKLDVMAPVRRKARENAYPLIGGIFLAGLVLGYLTGESDDDDLEDARPAVRAFGMNQDVQGRAAYSTHWEDRARTWEERARRLMDVANRQEAELAALRGEPEAEPRPRRGILRRRSAPPPAPSLRDALGDGLAMGLAGVISRHTSGEYDGMPLHDADSRPPHGDEDDYGTHDPLPAPV